MSLNFKFHVNQSINKDFITSGHSYPLPEPYLTPGRNRVNLFQGICYHKLFLDFKFRENPSINRDFMIGVKISPSLNHAVDQGAKLAPP